MEVANRRTNLHEQRFSFGDLLLVLRIGRVTQVMQGDRQHFGRRIEEADAARLQLGSVLGLEQQVPGIDWRVSTQRGLDLVRVDADTDRTPHVRECVLVIRVADRHGLEQRFVQVLPVRQLGLVQLLINASLDLLGQEVVGRYDDVIAGFASEQFGFERLVAVENVVDHLDARFFLELGNGVRRDVIGPVIDVQHFVIGLRSSGHNAHQGQREKGLAKFFHA